MKNNKELFSAIEAFVELRKKLEKEFDCIIAANSVHMRKEELFALAEEKHLQLHTKKCWIESLKEDCFYYEGEYKGLRFRTSLSEQEYKELQKKGDNDGSK